MNKIPKINIAKLYSDDVVSKLKVAAQIDEACRTYGCFIVKNHHISRVTIGKLLDKTNGFYNELGHKKKMEMAPNTYNKRNKHTYRGYVPQSRNSKQNFELFHHHNCAYFQSIKSFLDPEHFNIGNPIIQPNSKLAQQDILEPVNMNEPTQWPKTSDFPGFKTFFTSYYKQLTKLSSKLLRGFSLATGKDEEYFRTKFRKKDCMSTLKLTKFPTVATAKSVKIDNDLQTIIGPKARKETGFFNVLYQPQGLQININHSRPYESADWIDVKSSDIEYIVVVGSLLSQWTNHAYPAPEYRSKFMPESRLSVSYSAEPSHKSLIESYVPNEPELETLYSPVTYEDYKKRGDKLKLRNLPPIPRRNYAVYKNHAIWKI